MLNANINSSSESIFLRFLRFDFVFLCHDSAVFEQAHTALAAPSVLRAIS